MVPRVALFTDTFEQINGVALTSRQFVRYAERHNLPFLCVREGEATHVYRDGPITHVELRRSRLSVGLDRNLKYDLLLARHGSLVRRALDRFRPDLIHAVSPGDIGTLAVRLAKERHLPLAISWHTNIHEFGARRLDKILRFLPFATRTRVTRAAEAKILDACIAFYRLGDVLYAPNAELIQMLGERVGKPVHYMKRGIDTEMFHPARRTANDGILRLGYVGRITPEKNVRFLRDLESGLRAAGAPPFRIVLVGDGSEKDWLTANLRSAEVPGILRNGRLAEAYANMDVFVFPSRTDTFGNVVLEAFASGTPAVVTDGGGPKFIVRDGATGFVAKSPGDFIASTLRLLEDTSLRARMSLAAREYALGESWDQVFAAVYRGYEALNISSPVVSAD